MAECIKSIYIDVSSPAEGRLIGFSGISGPLEHTGVILYQRIPPPELDSPDPESDGGNDNTEPIIKADCLFFFHPKQGLLGPISACECGFEEWTYKHITWWTHLPNTLEINKIFMECPNPKCKRKGEVSASNNGVQIVSQATYKPGEAYNMGASHLYVTSHPEGKLAMTPVVQVSTRLMIPKILI